MKWLERVDNNYDIDIYIFACNIFRSRSYCTNVNCSVQIN